MDEIRKNFENCIKIRKLIISKYEKCHTMVNELISSKNDIIGVIKHDSKDNNYFFYDSIYDNSVYYIKNSLLVREKKFLKDLCSLFTKLDDVSNNMIVTIPLSEILDKIDEKFTALLLKTRNNNYSWIKDNCLVHIKWWVDRFGLFGKYHIHMSNEFLKLVELEYNFYNEEVELSFDDMLSSEKIHGDVNILLNTNNIKKQNKIYGCCMSATNVKDDDCGQNVCGHCIKCNYCNNCNRCVLCDYSIKPYRKDNNDSINKCKLKNINNNISKEILGELELHNLENKMLDSDNEIECCSLHSNSEIELQEITLKKKEDIKVDVKVLPDQKDRIDVKIKVNKENESNCCSL